MNRGSGSGASVGSSDRRSGTINGINRRGGPGAAAIGRIVAEDAANAAAISEMRAAAAEEIKIMQGAAVRFAQPTPPPPRYTLIQMHRRPQRRWLPRSTAAAQPRSTSPPPPSARNPLRS